MINVNSGNLQGDAHLLLTDTITSMIDAGYYNEAETMVVPYLKGLGITKIHHFFISHPHQDHYEGMEAIQNSGISINNVYYNMPPEGTKDCCYNKIHFNKFLKAAKDRGAMLHDIKEGFSLATPDLVVLHAHTTTHSGGNSIGVNDMSLVMRWTVEKYNVLFTGDLNVRVGQQLSTDDRMIADILKVPHHGGYGIAPDAFFLNVDPQFAMFPGPEWIYSGERGEQATNWAVTHAIPHCVNGINGSVKLTFHPDQVVVNADKQTTYCKNETFN